MNRYRLGFPVKVLGAPLRSHDSRRWQNHPHLSVSLAYVQDILLYLDQRDIRFYRLAGQLAPYATHPHLPQFHNQLQECATELAAIGDLARDLRIRLTLHPGHFVQLGSPDPVRVARSVQELEHAAALLGAMGLDGDAVIVVHVGGVGHDRTGTLERFAKGLALLSGPARARLALENDDRRFSLRDTLWIHRRTGIPLVLDTLHHRCLDPVGMPVTDALAAALATWPPGRRAKIHVSSPRTAVRPLYREGSVRWAAPLPNQHSDLIHPFEFIDLMRAVTAAGLRPFDIMLEAKGKDLALLRLRDQVAEFAPELAHIME